MHLTHIILSSIVHGLIYDVIYKTERHLGLNASILAAVIGIALVALASHFIFRSRRRRTAALHSYRVGNHATHRNRRNP